MDPGPEGKDWVQSAGVLTVLVTVTPLFLLKIVKFEV
jgi:hypothetical protein